MINATNLKSKNLINSEDNKKPMSEKWFNKLHKSRDHKMMEKA